MLGKGKDLVLRYAALKAVFLQTAEQAHNVHADLLRQNAGLREEAEHFLGQGMDAAQVVPADGSHKFGIDRRERELHRGLADTAAVDVSAGAAVKALVELMQDLLIGRGILLKRAALLADDDGERVRRARADRFLHLRDKLGEKGLCVRMALVVKRDKADHALGVENVGRKAGEAGVFELLADEVDDDGLLKIFARRLKRLRDLLVVIDLNEQKVIRQTGHPHGGHGLLDAIGADVVEQETVGQLVRENITEGKVRFPIGKFPRKRAHSGGISCHSIPSFALRTMCLCVRRIIPSVQNFRKRQGTRL